jgi:putative ABC transport system permease protein
MFFVTYVRRELRRRMRQTVVTALGLAVGIGLVITVTAAAAGVRDAQAKVLHALYGIGTDITVTTEAPPPPKPGTPEAAKGVYSPGPAEQHVDHLGLVPGLGALDATKVADIARLPGVAAAAGGLTMTDSKLTVPSTGDLNPDGSPKGGLPVPTTFTVDGVDVGHLGLGPLASARLTKGRLLATGDADAAVIDEGYATANQLTVGSTITAANRNLTVVGIVAQPQGGGAVDVYIPLGTAQALAAGAGLDTLTGKVSTIYVAATGAGAIPAVRDAIEALLPAATVTSSASLAGAVSGSLAGAADLATQLGRWLAVAALATAFAVASLLTVAAVTRRVREFGTLKALGWRGRRVVAQILGESVVTGLLGAVLGVALGFAGAALVGALAPRLSATVAQNPGSTPPKNVTLNGTGMHIQEAENATHTVAVHLNAPVTATTVALAAALAIAGALIAGSFGGWRAARLRPARALTRVE